MGCLAREKYCCFGHPCSLTGLFPSKMLPGDTHFTNITPKLQEVRPTSQILKNKKVVFQSPQMTHPNDSININTPSEMAVFNKGSLNDSFSN